MRHRRRGVPQSHGAPGRQTGKSRRLPVFAALCISSSWSRISPTFWGQFKIKWTRSYQAATSDSRRDCRTHTYVPAVIMYLWGMGLANPLGTAIAMGPFGREAGLASALLGFLTMSAAALTTWLGSTLNATPVTTLGGIQSVVCLIAVMLFLLGRRPVKL